MPLPTDNPFPAISPGVASERFLVKDESWASRFKANFDQFIIATFEFARPVIKLPVPSARTGNYALFLLAGGQVEVIVGHQAYAITAQQLLVIPALQIFSITAIREDTAGFMCFFSHELLLSAAYETDFGFLKRTGQPLVSLSAAQMGFVNNLFGRLMTEYAESGAGKTDIIRPYLLALLAEIDRAYLDTTPAKTDAGDWLVQRFTDLLHKHIRQKRLVTDYADLLNVSANHLNKVVKSRTGKSPSVWIDERIVLEAKVWLFQSDLTVAQIAGELGFDDPSNFGKLFRKYAQTSPAGFRNRIADPPDRMIDSDQSLPGSS